MNATLLTRRRAAVFAGVAVAAAVAAGAALAPIAGRARADTSTVAAEGRAVAIDNFTFGPQELAVPVGTTVVWTNRDDIPHTVTSDAHPLAFRSKPLDTGETFKASFDKPGVYSYFCSLHPHMQGKIIVR